MTQKNNSNRRGVAICTVVCFNERKIEALKKRLPAAEVLMREARRHKALGHPARQAVMHVLSISECCVCDLANILEKPVSTVSQHLRLLLAEGLLTSRREGKLVFYAPADIDTTQTYRGDR